MGALVDVVKMNAHATPDEQFSALGDDYAHAQTSGEHLEHLGRIGQRHEPILALALLRLILTELLDELRSIGLLLS